MEKSPWEANSRSVPAFYGTLRSLPSSKQPAIGPYPEPDESSPHLPTLFLKDLLQPYPVIYV
jgi:hypothetical protein